MDLQSNGVVAGEIEPRDREKFDGINLNKCLIYDEVRCHLIGKIAMQANVRMLRQPSWLGEFRAFIARGNVVDLAIGIIIGAAFTGVVGSLVKDVINPVIGLIIGGVDFSNIFVALNGQSYPTLDAAQKAGAPTLNIGLFINALINFVIIALVVFWIGKAAAKLIRQEAEAPSAPPAPTRSEVLLEEIRDELRGRTHE
jgi:large conductance mechanosensitive channel